MVALGNKLAALDHQHRVVQRTFGTGDSPPGRVLDGAAFIFRKIVKDGIRLLAAVAVIGDSLVFIAPSEDLLLVARRAGGFAGPVGCKVLA